MSLVPQMPDMNRRCFAPCPPGVFCHCAGRLIEGDGHRLSDLCAPAPDESPPWPVDPRCPPVPEPDDDECAPEAPTDYLNDRGHEVEGDGFITVVTPALVSADSMDGRVAQPAAWPNFAAAYAGSATPRG